MDWFPGEVIKRLEQGETMSIRLQPEKPRWAPQLFVTWEEFRQMSQLRDKCNRVSVAFDETQWFEGLTALLGAGVVKHIQQQGKEFAVKAVKAKAIAEKDRFGRIEVMPMGQLISELYRMQNLAHMEGRTYYLYYNPDNNTVTCLPEPLSDLYDPWLLKVDPDGTVTFLRGEVGEAVAWSLR